MIVSCNASRADAAPALYRLLSDSALSRAALGACGVPLTIIDATAATRLVTYVNRAFEGFFGYPEREALGRSLGALVFRGDDSIVHRLMAEPASRTSLRAWRKDGAARSVELILAAVRNPEGRITHWVATFADRSELEQLRSELEELKSVPAAA